MGLLGLSLTYNRLLEFDFFFMRFSLCCQTMFPLHFRGNVNRVRYGEDEEINHH